MLRPAALLAAALVTAHATSFHAQPPSSSAPVFFDDFTAPALDRAKWNVTVAGPIYNDEQQAYVDSTDTVTIVHGADADGAANGALVLQARYRPGSKTTEGKTQDFVSGRIDSRGKVEVTYGTLAARMKLPAGSGFWPAFWALGTGPWPDTGEIDVMENVGEADWTSVALHGPGYSGETPLVNKLFLPPRSDATAWHVYAVDWRPDGFVFRVDDTIAYRATRAMVAHYGRWAYENPKFLILNLALGGAYPLKTNGVKSPYPGLPAPTVDAIKMGRARVLVDWVRVTR